MDDPASLKEPQPADDGSRVEAALSEAPARPRRALQRRALVAAAAAACAVAIAVVTALASSGDDGSQAATAAAAPVRPAVADAVATPQSADEAPMPPPLKSRPRVVQALGPGEAPPDGVTAGSGRGASPQTDEEVRAEIAAFRDHLQGSGAQSGPAAKVLPDGTAVAPEGAPGVVKAVIAAGNAIAKTPYKWGGGHGRWRDSGYDCSGSVSFALAGAGLLDAPLNSTGFRTYGENGPGRWITLYTNDGHMFMVVAGLRFDTSGANGGTRWQPPNGRSYGGFEVRHPPGL